MKNFIGIVVLMGLVIVNGSSLFEQVLENDNDLDNDENNARTVTTDIEKLTSDASDRKNKDNRNAIGSSPIRNNLKRGIDDWWKDLAGVFLSLKTKGAVKIDDFFKVIKHPVDQLGHIVDLFLLVMKLPDVRVADIIRATPEIISIEEDLEGIVQCHQYVCNISVLGLNMTVGYDSVNIGLFLYIEFLGYTIINEKISTTGFRYCEPVELPIKKVKVCIEVSNAHITEESACLDLGFALLGYSHTFQDLCLFGSRNGN